MAKGNKLLGGSLLFIFGVLGIIHAFFFLSGVSTIIEMALGILAILYSFYSILFARDTPDYTNDLYRKGE